MAASFYHDDPWRRLPAEMLAALLLTLLALILFYEFLTANNYTLPAPKPVEMHIIVLSPTPAPVPAPPPAAPAAPEKTLPPQRQVQPVTPPAPLQRRKEALPQETRRAAEATPVYPAPPKARPAPPPPSEQAQAVPEPAAPAAPVITSPRAQAPEAAPPAATAPLTAAEQQMIAARRKKMAEEIYGPGGHGPAGDDERQRSGENRAYAPPLSPEEWKALDEMFFVGSPDFIQTLAGVAPFRAAMSPRAPPLTREQWAALDRIYHVGGYERYQEYRERLARISRPGSLATLADLTPDERHLILASRGVLPLSHGPALHMSYKLTLIDGDRMPAYNRRGSPPVVLYEVTPELPEALLKPPAQWNAVVRLQIDRLASTKVELTGSTGNDTVDRGILEALHNWRFRSAFYSIQLPMASTDELWISLVVK
jgi:outer membrane biosynthesis protein TonB